MARGENHRCPTIKTGPVSVGSVHVRLLPPCHHAFLDGQPDKLRHPLSGRQGLNLNPAPNPNLRFTVSLITITITITKPD